MESELTRLTELFNSVYPIIKIYYEKLDLYGFKGNEPYLSNEITDYLDYLVNIKFNISNTVKTNFELFAKIVKTVKIINRILEIFNDNKVSISKAGKISSSGSSITITYIENMMQELYNINLLINNLNNNIKINRILDLFNFNYNIEELDEVNKLYKYYIDKNIDTIDLYSYYLNKCFNNPEKTEIINNYLEELKIDILKTDIKRKIINNANAVQKLMQMFNLVPYSVSVDLDELYFQITETKSKKKMDLNSLIKNVDGAVIIIRKLFKNPMEYNYWTLVSFNNLVQPSEYGINKQTIERYRTIFNLDVPTESSDIIEMYNTDRKHCYIIETLNNKKFRLMISNKKKFNTQDFIILDNAPSQKLEYYNEIINSEIIKSIQKPLTDLETQSINEIKKEDNYWKIIRLKIINKLKEDVEKDFENTKDLTIANVNKIMNNDKLFKTALTYITDEIEIKKPEDSNIFETELLMSYFYDLTNIQKYMKKDFEVLYKQNVHKIERILENTSFNVAIRDILNIYNQILDEILDKFINRKSGIYLSIQKKYNILIKCLNN